MIRCLAVVAALAAAAVPVPAYSAAAASAAVPLAWVGTWAAAQVAPATTGLSHTGFSDETVRDIVHTSAGGSEIRIRLSNVFGRTPLTINDVRVARRSSGAQTVPGSGHQVTFGGKDKVTIPAGQREFSDPVTMSVGAEQDLAVSIFARGATGPATWHPGADATSYYSTPGDHAQASGGADYPNKIPAWYFLDGVDVVNPNLAGAVVTFGASTTDGDGSTPDANERYPDDLARKLLALPPGKQLSVLNAGIASNQLLGSSGTAGQPAVTRLYRDAINQSGVKAIIIWEGTNDIGGHPGITASQLTSAYKRLISEAHTHGIAIIGVTLQPDQGASYYTPAGNQVREAVNTWITTSGAFNAVLNFDAALQDPADPAELLPAYDSGDYLHPNDAGYQAAVNAISPQLFEGGSASPG